MGFESFGHGVRGCTEIKGILGGFELSVRRR